VVQDAKETTLKCQCSILELFPVFRGKITLVNFWFILVTTLYRQLGNDPKETTGTLGRTIQFLSEPWRFNQDVEKAPWGRRQRGNRFTFRVTSGFNMNIYGAY